jgi:hypothetical protein
VAGTKITQLGLHGTTTRRDKSFAGKSGILRTANIARGSLVLPVAPQAYERSNEQQTREAIRRADAQNFKAGSDVRLQQGERLILKSPNGSLWSITVANDGTITATPTS